MKTISDRFSEAKDKHNGALILFRLGDFYEAFYVDAKVMSRKLGLTLTTRGKGDDVLPMCGFPYHQLDAYVDKLKQDYNVAVVEDNE